MEVADAQGQATAATLGAQETVAVGMVEDAGFLMMLSSNLYSNQQLAMIREVLCNAWDANIEAGNIDTPLRITITESFELIIQDAGFGIPKEKFASVYGVYGGSTKKTNKAVTGGFGLGAKSPWAYVESFRVINQNQGTKTVYNLTKASVETGGLPAIQTVMSVPTEESGLTVKIQLQEEHVEQICLYIRYIVMHGDMNATFMREGHTEEPQVLAKLDLDPTPGSYDVNSERWYERYMGQHRLFVRYGAVIYPMLMTPGTTDAARLLLEFMEIVGFQKMVIQAAPGTLALTPSRESLSSSKMTENGITDLVVSLVARIEQDIIDKIPGAVARAIEKLQSGISRYHTLEDRASLTGFIEPHAVNRYLTNRIGAAKFAKYQRALSEAEQAGFKRHNVFNNKAATTAYHKLRTRIRGTSWQSVLQLKMAFARHFILRPLSRVFLANQALLNPQQMYHAKRFFWAGAVTKWQPLMNTVEVEEFDRIKTLIDRPTVFVTSRTRKLQKSIECYPEMSMVERPNTWVYKIEPRDKKKDAIVKAFTDAGMTVVDLTLNHDWDDGAAEVQEENERRNANRVKPVLAAAPTVTSKPGNALMSLTNVYDDEGNRKMDIYRIKQMKANLKTTDTPLFYIEADYVSSSGSLGSFGNYTDLSQEEKDHGVVVRNGVEKNMAIKRGAVIVDKYLGRKLFDAVQTPALATYLTKHRLGGVEEQFNVQPKHIELLQYLGIKLPGYDKLHVDAELERLYLRFMNVKVSTFGHYLSLSVDDLAPLFKLADLKLEEPAFVKTVQKLRRDEMIGRMLFAFSDPLDMIKKYPDRKAAIKSLVMSAMKGTQDEQ
ncbi:ATP-binding protein [Caballeronia sp. TF1N1]|uniref:ATP-binding protein n=1 Tax=Caballeronia sp. TF1N1 TaxID=2878153 RepID=UPI001FD59816|nr:ATP-binding protein [Caballeronia sp. TF1N1]